MGLNGAPFSCFHHNESNLVRFISADLKREGLNSASA